MEADPSVEVHVAVVHMVVAATVVVHSVEAHTVEAHTVVEVMAEAATVVVADTSEDVAKAARLQL